MIRCSSQYGKKLHYKLHKEITEGIKDNEIVSTKMYAFLNITGKSIESANNFTMETTFSTISSRKCENYVFSSYLMPVSNNFVND